MKNFKTLLFLDRFRLLFEKAGVDYKTMRRILQMKLLMDGRRVPTIFNQSQKKKTNQDRNMFIRSLWFYAAIGLILIPFIVLGENYMFQMTLVFAILMFIVMTAMISDFSAVLLDLRDQNILSTKPVNGRTINMAKTLHICIYMFLLTGAVTSIPLVVGLAMHGIFFFLLFMVGIVLVDLLIVFLTALLYFLILRFFDGEKLKDVINYVQIGLSIAIFIGYQLVIRVFDFVNFNIHFEPSWWHFFLPPVWYGASFEWLLNGESAAPYVVLSLLALIIPIVAIIGYVQFMPVFERNLQKLAEQSTKSKKAKSRKWTLANLICRNREERAVFRFAGHMMNQEREFKLKVYPSLGFSLIIPFIFTFNAMQESFHSLTSTKLYLSIYGCMIVIPTVVIMLNYSGKYKGAWIFKSTPVRDLLYIYRGTLKASIVKLFLPIFVIESLIFIVLFGLKVLPHLIDAFFAACIYALICFRALVNFLPFSESFSTLQQGSGWKVFPFIFLIAPFWLIHWGSTTIHYGVYVYMILLLIANGILWKTGFKKTVTTQHADV